MARLINNSWVAATPLAGKTITNYSLENNGVQVIEVGNVLVANGVSVGDEAINTRVRAKYNDATYGPYSNVVTIAAVSAPAAPTSVTAGTPTTTTIPLTWVASVTAGVTHYRIYVAGVLNNTVVAGTSGSAINLTPGQVYTNITIRSWNGTSESGNSNAVGATTAASATEMFPQDNAASLANVNSIGTWSVMAGSGVGSAVTSELLLNEVGVNENVLKATAPLAVGLSRFSIPILNIKKAYGYRVSGWVKALGTIQASCQELKYNAGFDTYLDFIPTVQNTWQQFSRDMVGIINGDGNFQGYMKNAVTADDKTLLVNKLTLIETGPVVDQPEEYYTANCIGTVNEANALIGITEAQACTNTSEAVDTVNGTYRLKSVRNAASGSSLNIGWTGVVGEHYRVRFNAKKGTAGATAKIQNWGGVPFSVTAVDLTTTWTEYEFYVKCSSASMGINMYHDTALTTNDGQTIYVDNFRLNKVTIPA